MDDPRAAMNGADGAADATNTRSRAAMAQMLQQAFRSFSGDRAGMGGTITPQMLTEIAQRAGITDSVQLSELARMIGINLDVTDTRGASIPQNIIFSFNDTECTFPPGSVQGIERVADISTVPNTVPWVLGIIHLHGAILSVVDLRGFFGLPMQSITQRNRLLVVTKRNMTIGLVVDSVNEMRQLTDASAVYSDASAPVWIAPYAQGTLNIEGRTVVMLDAEQLLFADKMHRYHA